MSSNSERPSGGRVVSIGDIFSFETRQNCKIVARCVRIVLSSLKLWPAFNMLVYSRESHALNELAFLVRARWYVMPVSKYVPCNFPSHDVSRAKQIENENEK
jgi:hypothetical protein